MERDIIKAPSGEMADAGAAASRAAAHHVFSNYAARVAPNTLARNRAALESFAAFLRAAGVGADAGELLSWPEAWEGVTWGLVAAFPRWLLVEGYAIGTVNSRLSTVKRYAALAAQAGTVPPEALAMIQTVKGYSRRQGRNVDQGRERTRRGAKKAAAVTISREQARALKVQPDTPQGRRDALLMCLLLEHGLRVGEVAALKVEALDLAAGVLSFYREKVDKVQTHRLTADSFRAALAYLSKDAPPAGGPLLLGSRRGGALGGGLGVRSMCERVRALGEGVGLAGLSPHDCRHHWATVAMRNGTDVKALQEAGGWASPAMPLAYAEAARIANEGVRLD